MWRKESLRKTGRKEDRGKEEREGRQKEEIKEAKQTTRKGKEEKGKVRRRVEEKDGGGERGVEGRKKKQNRITSTIIIIPGVRSFWQQNLQVMSFQISYELVTTKLVCSLISKQTFGTDKTIIFNCD